jgi:hypothetical protein
VELVMSIMEYSKADEGTLEKWKTHRQQPLNETHLEIEY